MQRDTGLKVVALQAQQLITEKQAAAMLAVSHTTLSTWRCRHRYQLPFVRVGGGRAIRYRLADVQAFISAGLVEADLKAYAAAHTIEPEETGR